MEDPLLMLGHQAVQVEVEAEELLIPQQALEHQVKVMQAL
jgi:hypothetical protein